jgi:hypothetical protein
VILENLLRDEGLEPEPGPAPKKQKGTKPLPPTDYQWEGRKRDCASKKPPMFPEGNYTPFQGLSPRGLWDLNIDQELLVTVRGLSNQYCMARDSTNHNITNKKINIFSILLLSGYSPVTDYDL